MQENFWFLSLLNLKKKNFTLSKLPAGAQKICAKSIDFMFLLILAVHDDPGLVQLSTQNSFDESNELIHVTHAQEDDRRRVPPEATPAITAHDNSRPYIIKLNATDSITDPTMSHTDTVLTHPLTTPLTPSINDSPHAHTRTHTHTHTRTRLEVFLEFWNWKETFVPPKYALPVGKTGHFTARDSCLARMRVARLEGDTSGSFTYTILG